MDQNPKRKSPLICLCNAVAQDTIETAIRGGCTSLGLVFDRTTAGVGACGGSCQPTLKLMLEAYAHDGHFPTDPRPPARRGTKRPRRP